MKIAYVGIDILYAAMPALLDQGCEIMEVFTCETDDKTEFHAQVAAQAEQLHVPCHLKPVTLEDLDRLRRNGCEALFSAGYYHKIPVLDGFPMINIHPAYLPVGRGAWPMPVTILQGRDRGGVTFHKLAEQMDAGDILLREAFAVEADENLQSYMEKAERAIRHLTEILMWDFSYWYAQAWPQGPGEYWDCPQEQDWTVRPEMKTEEIDRILRAFYGYECVWQEGTRRFELIGGKVTTEKPAAGICFQNQEGSYITAERVEALD